MHSTPVYEWLLDGAQYGCGTRAEFDHWNAQGINPAGLKLGAIITHEPASEDERRAARWAA